MADRRPLIRQVDVDALVDDEHEEARPPPPGPNESDERLDQLAAAFTTILDGEDSDSSQETAEESVGSVLDEIHSEERKLGQRGDCSLFVDAGRLQVYLRGALPAGTSQRDVLDWLDEVGIQHGVIPGRIFDALPRRRRRESQRGHADDEQVVKVVVAEGEAPIAPSQPTIEFQVEPPEESAFVQLAAVLQGQSIAEVRRLKMPAPLVRAGQILVTSTRVEGKPGRDVFGEELPTPPAADADLRAGDGALLDDGPVVRAEITGYAGLIEGQLRVVEPVWVAADLLAAYWVALPAAGGQKAPTEADLRDAIEAAGIVHQLDEAAIGRLAAEYGGSGPAETCTLIARGTDAERGTKGRWHFGVEPDETRLHKEIERILWKAPRPEYIQNYARGLSAWVVKAGHAIATKTAPTEGQMGLDVFGEEFLPDEPQEERLEAGDHVVMSGDGKSCFAEIYGIVVVEDRTVRVIPPLWLDPSRCSAYLVNLPQLGERACPSEDEVQRLIDLFKITYGVEDRAIGVLCEKLRQGIPVDIIERVANGDEPRSGRDAWFELAIELEHHSSMFRPDGSVDFRGAGRLQLVEEGDLLGTLTSTTPGTPGKNLFGQPLEALDGIELGVDLGRGVDELTGDDGVMFYRALTAGEITFVDHRQRRTPGVYLTVHKVLTIEGDVDFHTGNVDFEGTVQVNGNVCAGFSVRAEGNVIVDGTVENGAELSAGGNVIAALGIVGEDTRVEAAGSVTAKFVSNAEIRAGDTVTVCEYLQDARVKADEEVISLGRAGNRRSGAIIGGQVIAGRRIDARRIGADAGQSTQVVAGTRPSDLRRLAELNKTVAKCEELQRKLLQAFGAESMGVDKLRGMLLTMLSRAKGDRREKLAASIKSFMKLQTRLREASKDQEELRLQMRKGPLTARIEVHGPVAPNVMIRIGDQSLRTRDTDVTDVVFSLGKSKGGELSLRVQAN